MLRFKTLAAIAALCALPAAALADAGPEYSRKHSYYSEVCWLADLLARRPILKEAGREALRDCRLAGNPRCRILRTSIVENYHAKKGSCAVTVEAWAVRSEDRD